MLFRRNGIQSWRCFGDNLDSAIAKCLLCKYNPTKGLPRLPEALRNHLQAHHKKEFADMVKEEKKFKLPFRVKE